MKKFELQEDAQKKTLTFRGKFDNVRVDFLQFTVFHLIDMHFRGIWLWVISYGCKEVSKIFLLKCEWITYLLNAHLFHGLYFVYIYLFGSGAWTCQVLSKFWDVQEWDVDRGIPHYRYLNDIKMRHTTPTLI